MRDIMTVMTIHCRISNGDMTLISLESGRRILLAGCACPIGVAGQAARGAEADPARTWNVDRRVGPICTDPPAFSVQEARTTYGRPETGLEGRAQSIPRLASGPPTSRAAEFRATRRVWHDSC
jgi:hypothetical protein